jgi:hypothetical protein
MPLTIPIPIAAKEFVSSFMINKNRVNWCMPLSVAIAEGGLKPPCWSDYQSASSSS